MSLTVSSIEFHFKVSSDVSFFGITFAKGPTWDSHIKKKTRCQICKRHSSHLESVEGIHLIWSLCGTTWGAHQESLLLLYKARICSQFDKGNQAFGDMFKTNHKKMETIQSKALCAWLETFKSTPVSTLLMETDEMPFSLH